MFGSWQILKGCYNSEEEAVRNREDEKSAEGTENEHFAASKDVWVGQNWSSQNLGKLWNKSEV